MNMQQGIQQYQQVRAEEAILNATPHRLIQMLMEGAIERITTAKAHMQHKNIAEKGRFINKAVDIINGLRGSLNFEKGGEVAEDYERLYEFLVNHLMQANRDNNLQALDEATHILKEMKDAWDSIPEDVRNQKNN